MKLLSALFLLAPLVSASTPAAAADETVVPWIAGEVGHALDVVLPIGEETLWLQLEPASVRAPGFQLLEQRADGFLVPVDPGPVRTVAGAIVGEPGSEVRGAWLDDGLHLRLERRDGTSWIEPSGNGSGGEHRLSRGPGRASVAPGPDGLQRQGIGTAFYTAELACDADFRFYESHGSSTAATSNRVQLLVNTVNAQFQSQISITHRITVIVVRASAAQDPYTATSYTGLLAQVRNHWNATMSGTLRDSVELFTGEPIANLASGNVGQICNTSEAYEVTGDRTPIACATDDLARSLGLIWGAFPCSCTGTTMSGITDSCANRFSPTETIPSIRFTRNNAPCIEVPCLTASSHLARTAPGNLPGLSITEPLLGEPWSASLDLSGSGFQYGGVVAFANPAHVDLGPRGVLLGNGPELLGLAFQRGPTVQYDLVIPRETRLCGYEFTCQGVQYIDDSSNFVIRLTNGFDCVIGF